MLCTKLRYVRCNKFKKRVKMIGLIYSIANEYIEKLLNISESYVGDKI